MKKYNLSTFLQNIDQIGVDMEMKEKKEGIANIISSLQRPFTDSMTSVYQEQKKQVNELLKYLKWRVHSK